MKILMVCEGITKYSIIAQPWKHVFELANRMIQYGNDVELLTNFTDKEAVDSEIDGVPIIRVKKGEFFFHNDQLLKYLNDEKFDIINWHGSDAWSTANVWCMREKLKKNVVLTLHSGPLSFSDFKNLSCSDIFITYKFWNNILNSVFPSFVIKRWMNLPQIRYVITLSERAKSYLIRRGIKKDNEIKVIRSGVDTKKFSASNKRLLDRAQFSTCIEKSNKSILYFGPLSRFRGVDTLLAAMPEVIKNVPSARLLLLVRERTSNNENIKLEEKAKKIRGVIIVKGILTEELLIKYLDLADVVVLPFKFWPQVECPLTLLEAMAMEKPILVTKVGAIPEIIRDHENGILVPSNNPKILAKSVIELLNDEVLAKQISRSAREYAEKFYSWDTIVQETLEVFGNLL